MPYLNLRSVTRLKMVPLIVSMIVLVLTVILVSVINDIQNHNQQAVLESAASRQADLLRDQVNSDIDFIGSAANFFQSSSPSNWSNFDRFAKEVVGSSKSLMSLQWLQKVTPENIDDFIKSERHTSSNFNIYTITKNKKFKFNGNFSGMSDIYVVTDIYPRTKYNLEILGYYSISHRTQHFFDNIRTTKQPNVSDSVSILSDTLASIKNGELNKNSVTSDTHNKKDKRGLLIDYPVFNLDNNEMIGVVVGVVDLTVYMNSVIQHSLNGIHSKIRIIDTGIGSRDFPIMYKSKGWDLTKGTILTRKVTLPNRVWLVEFKQANEKKEQDLWVLIGIACAGVIISVLVYFIVAFQRGEKERIEAQLKLKTKELQFLVNRDVLTKLRNRRSFNQYIDKMFSRETTFTLISIDIDKFKSINDNYGHVFGDQALIHVATIVHGLLAKEDKLFRLGGDEFSIITQQINVPEVEQMLFKICHAVNNTILRYKGDEIYCSLSIGAAISHDDDDVETLMTRTDNALYESKKKGRNCFFISL
ncbi:sensor domain-containing diguanylate cyclase [Photobacterium angustum]|uniref:diguanylate cyclase n=2 Tax=Photobacterium angustum TaxID=661 RepID=A0A2S7VWY6_PHOAN|nr:sensor domain-containing diguanylate cyclase [Photobacterium angustum]